VDVANGASPAFSIGQCRRGLKLSLARLPHF